MPQMSPINWYNLSITYITITMLIIPSISNKSSQKIDKENKLKTLSPSWKW